MTVGVVLFPGSNCEQDAIEAVRHLGGDAELLWHGDDTIGAADAVIVPGGFAHGDYLRPGAIARFSPIMGVVAKLAADGGPVVGICNGFQVLTEAGMLPCALQKNTGLTFLCEPAELPGGTTRSPLTWGGRAVFGSRPSVPSSPGRPRRARGCGSRSTTSRATTSATPTPCAG